MKIILNTKYEIQNNMIIAATSCWYGFIVIGYVLEKWSNHYDEIQHNKKINKLEKMIQMKEDKKKKVKNEVEKNEVEKNEVEKNEVENKDLW